MTEDETTVLIGFINAIDPRIVFDDLVVSAWKNVLPPNITLDEAMGYVREHYQETEKSVFPANIVARHRLATTKAAQAIVAGPHDCYEGWVMVEEQLVSGETYRAAARCPVCNTRKQ